MGADVVAGIVVLSVCGERRCVAELQRQVVGISLQQLLSEAKRISGVPGVHEFLRFTKFCRQQPELDGLGRYKRARNDAETIADRTVDSEWQQVEAGTINNHYRQALQGDQGQLV